MPFKQAVTPADYAVNLAKEPKSQPQPTFIARLADNSFTADSQATITIGS